MGIDTLSFFESSYALRVVFFFLALMLGLVHTLVSSKLHDEAFLARYCAGFERVRAYVMGETDGEPKDAQWAAGITGIAADTIRSLAHRMAQTCTMVSASWSLQRADHGEHGIWGGLFRAPGRFCAEAFFARPIFCCDGFFGFIRFSGRRFFRYARFCPSRYCDLVCHISALIIYQCAYNMRR